MTAAESDLARIDDGDDWPTTSPTTSPTSARGLLLELHRRAPKDVAVCAGIALVPFVTPHKLSRAAHEARALAIAASRGMYWSTARDGWACHYALLSMRAAILGEDQEAERFRKHALRVERVRP